MKCKLTNGNQKPGEYMVRELNPSQLYEVIRDGFTVEMVPDLTEKWFLLKNKVDGEIADIGAISLELAKYKAAMFLGGKPSDYVERF